MRERKIREKARGKAAMSAALGCSVDGLRFRIPLEALKPRVDAAAIYSQRHSSAVTRELARQQLPAFVKFRAHFFSL